MNDPQIIIDAWEFEGFSTTNGTEENHGLTGVNMRVKSKGHLEIETSWGNEIFREGDKVLVVDIAACVSDARPSNWLYGLNRIESIVLTFLHEICHWAEEVWRPGREHARTWNPFLVSVLQDHSPLLTVEEPK